MKRRVHVPSLYVFGPAVAGPAGFIAWQEGYATVAGLLGVTFAALVAGGVRKLRVYWR